MILLLCASFCSRPSKFLLYCTVRCLVGKTRNGHCKHIHMIFLHYFGFKRSKNVFTNYLWELASKLVISGCFHLLHAFMSLPLCGVREAKDGVFLGSLESHVCGIYFRNLFNAFDTSKQGRISLDYNQFIYCGMISFLTFFMITQHIPLWVGCGCLGDLYCYLFCIFFKDCSQFDLLERLCTHNIMTGPSSFDDPFLCQVSILAVPISKWATTMTVW